MYSAYMLLSIPIIMNLRSSLCAYSSSYTPLPMFMVKHVYNLPMSMSIMSLFISTECVVVAEEEEDCHYYIYHIGIISFEK